LLCHIPRDQDEDDRPVVPQIVPLALYEDRGFTFIQSSETSASHYDLSERIKSGLAMTYTRSLSSYGYIPSGTMEACMPRVFKYTLTRSPFPESKS